MAALPPAPATTPDSITKIITGGSDIFTCRQPAGAHPAHYEPATKEPVDGAYISSPWFFGAEELNAAVKTVDFLSIATVMLTLAGLCLGKDIPLLKNIGWKIIPEGLVAITASFLLSTVIAEFALGLWH